MGAWGTGLYDNDTTCDVRNTYMDFLQEQFSNQEVYEKTFEMYKDCIGDIDDEPLFWFALAETQWKVGRLMPEVKATALEWIEKEGGVLLWEDSPVGNSGWKKTLEKLKTTLEAEQRKEKKIRKPQVINHNLWNIGDVYAYQFHKEQSDKYGVHGEYVLMQKIGEEFHIPMYCDESYGSEKMRVHVFNKLFDHVPTLEDVKGLPLLPIGWYAAQCDLRMNMLMELYKKKDYPKKHLAFLGNTQISANKLFIKKDSPCFWSNFEGLCANSFLLWQGKKYEEIEEGVFRYTQGE